GSCRERLANKTSKTPLTSRNARRRMAGLLSGDETLSGWPPERRASLAVHEDGGRHPIPECRAGSGESGLKGRIRGGSEVSFGFLTTSSIRPTFIRARRRIALLLPNSH